MPLELVVDTPDAASAVDSEPSPPKASHRLWGGRFSGKSSAIMDALNRSIGVDFRLWPFDIELSKAWAVALWDAGVLTLDESKAIEPAHPYGLHRYRVEQWVGERFPAPAEASATAG